MKFAIITHAFHKKDSNSIYAYEPYVREMNLWCKYVSEVKIVAPISVDKISTIEEKYLQKNISITKIPSFNTLNLINKLKSVFLIPVILFKIFRAMLWADHIHLRSPGNIALLGCFVQILFPFKPKTVKYAGNWDPKSKQPISYRIQKWLVSNTFLTRNCKVLVYGKWENQSKNIIPFFTASYNNNEIEELEKKDLSSLIKFIFVGAFSEGKQPLVSVKLIEALIAKNIDVRLNMYGEGSEFEKVSNYVLKNNLSDKIILHGNKPKEVIKEAYKDSHFLIFISKSEGWPKVVAEAMFWSCLPISTKVSCVDYMLDYGKRGTIVSPTIKVEELLKIVIAYINNNEIYLEQSLQAKKWSQNYTLDNFEKEIKKILLGE